MLDPLTWLLHRSQSPWLWLLGAVTLASAALVPGVAWRIGFSLSSLRTAKALPAWLCECLAIGALFALACLMLPSVALGDAPIGMDHSVHLFRAWEMKERLLHGGWPWGWSHLWFAGYPSGYLYPIASDLWIAFFATILSPVLSFFQSYAIAFFCFFVFQGCAVYLFARQGFGRLVSLGGAALYMTDGGAIEAGGWVWSVDYGVWPVALSIAFAMVALTFFLRAMRSGRSFDIGGFGLFMGWSLLAHPIEMVAWLMLLPVALVSAIAASPTPSVGRIVRVVGCGVAIGLGIGALWLLPFLSTSAYTTSMGTQWHSIASAGAALHDGNLLGGTWPACQILGALGLFMLVGSRHPARLMAPLAVFAVLFFGSTTFIRALHIDKVYPVFDNILIGRFQMIIKPFWFIAASAAVAACWTGASRALGRSSALGAGGEVDGRVSRALRGAMVGGIIVPFALSFAAATVEREVKRHTALASARTDDADRRELTRWARTVSAEEPGFFRIAHVRGEPLWHDVVGLGIEVPEPLYKMTLMPTTYYKYKVYSDSNEILSAVNVKYVFSPSSIDRPDFKLVRRLGEANLYEFTGWQKDPFAVTDGHGNVELERFDPERIVLSAKDGASGTLRLNVSYFPRWHAYRDGSEVPIKVAGLAGDPSTGFMTVDLAPGVYQFVFRRSLGDVLALGLFIVSSAAAMLMLLAEYAARRRVPWLGLWAYSGWRTRGSTPAARTRSDQGI